MHLTITRYFDPEKWVYPDIGDLYPRRKDGTESALFFEKDDIRKPVYKFTENMRDMTPEERGTVLVGHNILHNLDWLRSIGVNLLGSTGIYGN